MAVAAPVGAGLRSGPSGRCRPPDALRHGWRNGEVAPGRCRDGSVFMSESRRSAACANELHGRCPHLMTLRLTGGFLCRCPCHSTCPVSRGDDAAFDAWWDACICPGSGWQRDKGRQPWPGGRPPSVPELARQLRAQEAALARARARLAGQAQGLPAHEVRQLLEDELRAQGAGLPAESVLDREAGRIQRAVPPGAGLLRTVRSLASQYRQVRSSARQLQSEAGKAQTLHGPHGEPPYFTFDTDYSLLTARCRRHRRSGGARAARLPGR